MKMNPIAVRSLFIALVTIASTTQLLWADHETENVQNLNNLTAATMNLRNQAAGKDGKPTLPVFQGVNFESGDRLVLENASGLSIFRIHQNKIEGATPCPNKWMLNFVDRAGRILPSSPDSPEELERWTPDGILVPEGAQSAWLGFTDSAYFDNEGIRFTNAGSTRGCSFQFRIVRRPIMEEYNHMLASRMMLKNALLGKDGDQPQEIFIGKLRPGSRLSLFETSGNSIFRVQSNGIVPPNGFSQCPQSWKVQYTDAAGNLIPETFESPEALENYQGRSVKVPREARQAFIGFSDSAYFDNEGKRNPKMNSTRGCRFVFALSR